MSDALRIERSAAVLTLWLNRPTLHNAFDAGLIAQLTAALEAAGRDEQVRAVVLAATGASFSAGADMQWMRGMAAASEEDNRQDSLALARLMRSRPSPGCTGRRSAAAWAWWPAAISPLPAPPPVSA
jgi:methylglutaconyl-CoA hydratase